MHARNFPTAAVKVHGGAQAFRMVRFELAIDETRTPDGKVRRKRG